jgi:hypothetical protein
MPIVCASAAFTPVDEFHSDFFRVQEKRGVEQRHFTGQEHSQIHGYYLSDDELLDMTDEELDAHAYENWRHARIEEGIEPELAHLD